MASEVEVKAKAAEALKLRDALKAREALARKNPTLWAQYQKVMGSFGSQVADKVMALTGVYDSAKAAFVKLYQTVLGDEEGLGVAPLVVGAAGLTVALTAMTYWVSDAYKLKAALDAQQALVDKGYSPEQAAAAVKGSSEATGGGIADGIAKSAKAIQGLAVTGLVAGGLWMFRDEIAGLFKRNKGSRG